jgi:hypothetical protein
MRGILWGIRNWHPPRVFACDYRDFSNHTGDTGDHHQFMEVVEISQDEGRFWGEGIAVGMPRSPPSPAPVPTWYRDLASPRVRDPATPPKELRGMRGILRGIRKQDPPHRFRRDHRHFSSFAGDAGDHHQYTVVVENRSGRVGFFWAGYRRLDPPHPPHPPHP